MDTSMSDRRWTGADLRASREALGISQGDLAEALVNPRTGKSWKQYQLSRAEGQVQYRYIPDWVAEKMEELEAIQDGMIEGMFDALGEGSSLYIHKNAGSYMEAHPEGAPSHAAIQRTAAAIAVREHEAEHGIRPIIQYWDSEL